MRYDRVRFGIVGAGAISQGYGQAFQGCGEAVAVAVADTRLDAAKSLGEVLGCPAFTSHAAMADACELDAVLICTPPSSHAEICLDFIDRGVNVLCEKPFTVTVAEAETVVCTAREKGVKITMASKFRYVDDVIRAKQIVDSGILGDVVLFDNAFTARVDMSRRWNSDPTISGGGVLIDNGTHSVDIARYFLGPLSGVHVMEGRRSQGLKVEDTVQVFVRSERGAMGTIDLSWSINKELERYISIYGSQGTVIVGWKKSRYRQASSPDWVSFGTGYDKVRAFRNQIVNFSRAIRGDDVLLIDGTDALASVRVVDAAYQSLQQNHWISVSNGASATA
ncbi:MAG TPA: Gfo/Idh/MocA family oxidoreductase [Thermoanaerobaculales bacterium]|nr:Gfo/Idh/MocA family oxidoreductase [Thermoanaerobaculales bacterium]